MHFRSSFLISFLTKMINDLVMGKKAKFCESGNQAPARTITPMQIPMHSNFILTCVHVLDQLGKCQYVKDGMKSVATVNQTKFWLAIVLDVNHLST